jgi:hypothetical protein
MVMVWVPSLASCSLASPVTRARARTLTDSSKTRFQILLNLRSPEAYTACCCNLLEPPAVVNCSYWQYSMSTNASAFRQHRTLTWLCAVIFSMRRAQVARLLNIRIVKFASSVALKSVWGLMAVNLWNWSNLYFAIIVMARSHCSINYCTDDLNEELYCIATWNN